MAFDIADEFTVNFIKALQEHGVRYMLIGGVALNYHGVDRTTEDMDIWLAPTNENRDLFYDVLLEVGYQESEIALLKEQNFTSPFKCTVGDEPGTIDCLTVVHPDINFDTAEKNIIRHNIGENIILNIVDFDLLRKMKLLTHRPKDWYDVARMDEFKKKK